MVRALRGWATVCLYLWWEKREARPIGPNKTHFFQLLLILFAKERVSQDYCTTTVSLRRAKGLVYIQLKQVYW